MSDQATPMSAGHKLDIIKASILSLSTEIETNSAIRIAALEKVKEFCDAETARINAADTLAIEAI
jgi:hypothetical protein